MAKRMSKQMRKKRAIRVTLIVIIVLALLAGGVGLLRRRVTSELRAGNAEELQTATVTRGSITTVVSGSGNLTDEDVEALTLHGTVEIDETLVEAGDTVAEGDILATVNMSTVLSAMAQVQSQINDLDDEIGEASGDELDDSVTTTVAGRVMKLYAEKGDDVSTVLYENGALALLSLDGYLAVDIETAALAAGDEVTVTDSQGSTYEGIVDTVGGKAEILISDKSAEVGDTVTVTDSEGTALGTGKLYIHEELKITGIAGTVKAVKVSEHEKVKADKTLFTLTDTSFSANYTTLLEERTELEEQLQQLVRVYQDGAVLAPLSGIISSLGDSDSSSSSQMSYGSFNMSGAGTAATATVEEQTLLSICPGTKMTVSISVDEGDILSLQEGQTASIAVDALGDEIVSGTVTEIDTTATSSGGVTVYTVTVTFDKTEQMLSGMSADVAIVIEGVEDALLIPSEALTQTSATSYVYTTYDAETGELGGMVEVTTGLNNGSYVEITGGLRENDTVYYFENQEQGFGSFGGMSGFGGMGGMDFGNMGGGGMPNFGGGSGGGMPSFGGNSGGGMPNFGGGNSGGGMPGGMGQMPGGRG